MNIVTGFGWWMSASLGMWMAPVRLFVRRVAVGLEGTRLHVWRGVPVFVTFLVIVQVTGNGFVRDQPVTGKVQEK